LVRVFKFWGEGVIKIIGKGKDLLIMKKISYFYTGIRVWHKESYLGLQ